MTPNNCDCGRPLWESFTMHGREMCAKCFHEFLDYAAGLDPAAFAASTAETDLDYEETGSKEAGENSELDFSPTTSRRPKTAKSWRMRIRTKKKAAE